MHELLCNEIVENVRRRAKEGDRQTTMPWSIEILEQAVDSLARDRDAARRLAESRPERMRQEIARAEKAEARVATLEAACVRLCHEFANECDSAGHDMTADSWRERAESYVTHRSDCARHNEPAERSGRCDCGAIAAALRGGNDG